MVKSVFRTIKILEFLGEHAGANVTDISKNLRFPKSTAHDILTTLEQENIVAKDQNNRYHLGLKLFELGSMAQTDLEIRRIAQSFLRQLNSELDETVHLTVLEGDEVLYVDCLESSKRLRTYSVIGVRAPLYCTSVGKAILAFLEHDVREKILAHTTFEKFTENTIIDKIFLEDELHTIAQRGYAVDNMEHEEGLRCIGAPIRNRSGRVFAAISVSGPSQRITLGNVSEIGKVVMAQAENISEQLGYHKG
ncbi:IclR family transcriptional regulator [candidate division KSB3 bacterium]|uniref:IclR family transcriptional regulator n=1 Tax=candidate division KSB3 bacterium TaxID=2044937 RepID=A0A2G6KEB5_9BACT|nr:MAG: IclR family transcriptional regulator [candidate division KSB3 bacterium]